LATRREEEIRWRSDGGGSGIQDGSRAQKREERNNGRTRRGETKVKEERRRRRGREEKDKTRRGRERERLREPTDKKMEKSRNRHQAHKDLFGIDGDEKGQIQPWADLRSAAWMVLQTSEGCRRQTNNRPLLDGEAFLSGSTGTTTCNSMCISRSVGTAG
jgi:hypothetical protein